MRTRDDLRQMQALPLHLKVELTKARIRQWVHEYGEDGVYVSFSGGKDSTVLLNIVREMFPSVVAMFVNTGLEFPETVQFVKSFENVDIIRPDMNFKKVIEKYGYPFPSKEAAECIYGARRYLKKLRDGQTDGAFLAQSSTESCSDMVNTQSQLEMLANSTVLADILNSRMSKRNGGNNQRLAQTLGMYTNKKTVMAKETIPDKDRSLYSQEKWSFFLRDDAPTVSNLCCKVMKKNPAHAYSESTGRKPITGEMADESRLRTQKWLQNGCNGFNMDFPKSTPMAFWKEQDVLQYIKENNIRICSVYGEVVPDDEKNAYPEGQTMLQLDGSITEAPCTLKTTGCSRTGCVYCGFGCHMEKPGEGRFERLKITHPKLYEWIMKPWDEGGLGYKEVIDWINENNGKGAIIRY